jgi:D-beta-D-heptose 7-phosphate kinase/D-beta-D-heptose 1-phosphate adenosyltransferase
VEVQKRTWILGGAANTAANVAALGGKPIMLGVVGADAEGDKVRAILAEQTISTAALLRDERRPTTTKTRIIAHSQQVVRIDHEVRGAIDESLEARCLSKVEETLPQVRGIVISDYGKGLVTERLAQRTIALAALRGIPVLVDPKGADYSRYRGATLIKPNQLEAGQVLNRDLRTREDVQKAGRDLVQLLGPDSALLITRGSHGMMLFQQGGRIDEIPAMAREVFDVTGAGDTVAATLVLSLAVGADLPRGCGWASRAAAIVVGKAGTATCTWEELASHFPG